MEQTKAVTSSAFSSLNDRREYDFLWGLSILMPHPNIYLISFKHFLNNIQQRFEYFQQAECQLQQAKRLRMQKELLRSH